MTLFNNIIVPLDGSELSAQALPAASIMARASGASMTLLRCFDPIPQWQVDAGQGRFRGSMALAEHDRVSALLRAEKHLLERRGVDAPITVLASEGPAPESIINLANQQPDALITMSTHGRGGFSRMLMGSVTAKVVRAARNPTLIVRCNERTVRWCRITSRTSSYRWTAPISRRMRCPMPRNWQQRSGRG